MNNKTSLNTLLVEKIQKMAELLTIANQPHWARRLVQISHSSSGDESMARDVLSLYGGMGSLNDLVLYVEGVLDAKINDEFDALRTAVYELCYSRGA
jgi:hypothetical protein